MGNSSTDRRASNRARGNARGYPRVRARPIHPGDRVKVNRRCLERRFFMVPDPTLNQIIGYWLAVCLERHGIELHAACFMSNHYHLDVTDRFGNLPAFKNHFNAVLARAINRHRRRFDRVWSEDRSCDVRLIDDDDLLDRMVYTLANPVTAGLVRRASRWPGLTTAGMCFGESRTFKRPTEFFDGNNEELPAFATLNVIRPDVMPDLSDRELFARVQQELHRREQEAAAAMSVAHRRFAGEQRVRRQRWQASPGGHGDRFTRIPGFASSNKWSRIAQAQRNRIWERSYAFARTRWLDGSRDVPFPAGTYWMRRFAGVPVGRRETGPP